MQQDCEIITKRGKGCGMIEKLKLHWWKKWSFKLGKKNGNNPMSFNEVKCEIVSEGKDGGPLAPSNVVYQQCKYT